MNEFEADKARVRANRLVLAETLDRWYHKYKIPFLKWSCNWYDNMLMESAPTSYDLRCPVCEGIQYPGLTHNELSPECTYNRGPCPVCGAHPGFPCDAALHS